MSKVATPQKRGPESAFFDTLKGQTVLIDLHGAGAEPTKAKLLWVDRYTIGIRPQDGGERMIYKKYIRAIERDENNAVGTDAGRESRLVVEPTPQRVSGI